MMRRGERNLRSFFELVFCLWIRAGLVPVILWVVFLLFSDLCFATAQFNGTGTGTGLSRTQLLRIEKHLKRLNKEAVKSIQSPDGDVIDCVLAHKQPAFDHPRVKGLKPEEPPVTRPKGYHSNKETSSSSENLVNFQIWHQQAERCPEGSIPIRRTKREDILRFGSVKRYGRKKLHHRPFPGNPKRRDSLDGGGHEHAVGYVAGDEYYGAKSSLNVWSPHIQKSYEFSLSQMWLISGPFGNDLNTIEAGWQVSPELYGDSYPRFFTYWTTDAYQATGCYNLLCSGFVQTNNGVAIGAAISPTSVFNGAQYDISLLVWKDPNKGNWWLEFGNGMLVGYWPSFLFSHLAHHATMVQWGGEIVNTSPGGRHTGTQMGSGHFAEQGFAKASYFRNLEVVDWDNSLISLTNMQVLADHPNCYNIQAGFNEKWGNYFYYGGPGRNSRCP